MDRANNRKSGPLALCDPYSGVNAANGKIPPTYACETFFCPRNHEELRIQTEAIRFELRVVAVILPCEFFAAVSPVWY